MIPKGVVSSCAAIVSTGTARPEPDCFSEISNCALVTPCLPLINPSKKVVISQVFCGARRRRCYDNRSGRRDNHGCGWDTVLVQALANGFSNSVSDRCGRDREL